MPLDETIDSGQAGHIADHETIAAALNAVAVATVLGSDLTTTSTSWVTTGLTQAFTPVGTTAVVSVAGSVQNEAAAHNFFRVTDGTTNKPFGKTFTAAGVNAVVAGQALFTGLTAGVEVTFTVQAKVSNGTLNCRASSFPEDESLSIVVRDG